MSYKISKTIEIVPKIKPGRNDPCYCGSGKKYKKCHLRPDEEYQPSQKLNIIGKIVDFLTVQPGFKELVEKNIREIFGQTNGLEETGLMAVMEATVFEGTLKGQTPFAFFLNNAALTENEKNMYYHWQEKGKFSLFEIKSVMIGKYLEVIDLVSNQTFLVYEHLATYQAEPGVVLVARVVPWQDNWIFTGGSMYVYGKEAAYLFKRRLKLSPSKNLSQLEFIKTIFNKEAQPDWRFKEEAEGMGSKEKMLIHELMDDAHRGLIEENKDFEQLPKEEQQKRIDIFSQKWFETPQEELTGKTPKEVIMEERRELGEAPKTFKYHLSVQAVPGGSKEEVLYNQAVSVMKEYKYLAALRLFVGMIGNVKQIREQFRFWGNVGGCLANLGEVELARRCGQKALELKSDYELVRKNLDSLNDPKTQQSLILTGNQRLFRETLTEGLIFSQEIAKNSLLLDIISFLNYIKQNRLVLTTVRKSIKLKDVLAINTLFLRPDPKGLEIKGPKGIFIDTYKDEYRFPKVLFLHIICLTARFIRISNGRLFFTKKGEEFLEENFPTQFNQLLEIWFTFTNWDNFNIREGWVHELEGSIPTILQNISFTILRSLYRNKKMFISFPKIMERIKPEDGNPLADVVASVVAERIFLQHLVWAELVETKGHGGIFDLNRTYRVSQLGESLIEQVEEKLKLPCSQLLPYLK